MLIVTNTQNTQEKFGSDPEDCDQKEMYKLLVSRQIREPALLLVISNLTFHPAEIKHP